MTVLETILFAASFAAVLLWAALSLHVLAVERRRFAARALLEAAREALNDAPVGRVSDGDQVARLQPLLAHASRVLVMEGAADPELPEAAFAAISGYLSSRWGIEGLVANARGHRSTRDKWRRMAALRILVRMSHPEALSLLTQAVRQRDADVANTALALLGASADPRAADVLIDALKRQNHPASRIAVHIEQCRLPIAERLIALLNDNDPVVRLWGATLLARFPGDEAEHAVAPLTRDADPRVRKAAVQTLGRVGDVLAGECAEALLSDPYPYVRAHAARALADLDRTDLAERVAALLGDAEWWVRLAARESLEAMGVEVWPVAMRYLDHPDGFVRNGAAEVIQNLGILDSLIVMEAASDQPARAKIALLARIASAGGVHFTDAMIERAGPTLGPRIRHLLTAMGLEHVAA